MNQRLDAVAVRKYTDKNTGEEKSQFTRIGVAWAFKEKEGYSVKLDAIPAPVDGVFEILLFPPKPRDDQGSQQSNDFGRGNDGDSITF